jgi:ubiquinone/menaquinone biosynthesis C-methylase UbiE
MSLPSLQIWKRGFTLPDFSVRSDERELLDEPIHDQRELDANLRDIRRINLLLGGKSTTLRHLPRLFAAIPSGQPITILDLATGSGDIPLAITRLAARTHRQIQIIASDFDEAVQDAAHQHIGNRSDITIEQYDARAVPLPDGSVDIVLCSLALHHFAPSDAVAILREMDRLARVGFILNDLRRSRLGWISATIMTRVTTRNRLTRNDAPLSVRRAYTPTELAELLQSAGISGATISRHHWFRMAAVKINMVPDARY